jgi:enamine deaminase RidA (YjgF/YER057c/UK114 family)
LTHQILQPAGWLRPAGYAHGVAARGRLVFVAGQIGWTRDQQFLATDLTGQVRQALSNVVRVLAEAGAGPDHVTRMTWYLTDRREYLDRAEEIGGVYREVMGRHFPAMSVVEVSALLEEAAKVEIEVTAVIPE